MRSAGRLLGRLASVNTVGAILGSLAAGFILLEVLGPWNSIRVFAGGYLVLAVVCLPHRGGAGLARGVIPVVGIGFLLLGPSHGHLQRVRLVPARGERLVEVREGPGGTVAITDRNGDLGMKVNNTYLLGTSGASPNLRMMSYLPLALHPEPRRVFFLGMGTGITAGGSLDFPVEHVRIAELSGDVVRASRDHFRPFVNGIFEDPRVQIVTEDGRNYLFATTDRYDVIVADIFLTYRSGVGSLYTREHFETVRTRLEPGGLFALWVTMFDLSPGEFGILARTALEVFPEVVLWRRGFSPTYPVYALIAGDGMQPLDPERLGRQMDRLVAEGALPQEVWIQRIPLAAYAGNLRESRSLFSSRPVSTDDRTPLEYLAPITERNSHGAGVATVLAWEPLAAFCESLLAAAPPERDPYLRATGTEGVSQVRAGLAFYRYENYRRMNRPEVASRYFSEYEHWVRVAGGPGSGRKAPGSTGTSHQ